MRRRERGVFSRRYAKAMRPRSMHFGANKRHRRKLAIEPLERRDLLAGDIVMFNDHVSGGGTHQFVTTYAANGISSGLLVDNASGLETGITLSTSGAGVSYESATGTPPPGSEADDVFGGWVDFSSGGGASIALSGPNDFYSYELAGLDSQKDYELVATAVRGNAGYVNRWTLVTLEGADAFTAAHSEGVGIVTSAENPSLAANQVALWTGENHLPGQGWVVQWVGIDPGPDGQIEIVSQQYEGPTPGVGSGNSTGASKGYGIAGIRLTELDPSFRIVTADPPNGAALIVPPATYVVDFNQPVDVATVQASDLTVDGAPATAIQQVDDDTIEFTLPTVQGEGFHQVAVAAGAITSEEGLPVAEYVGSFAIINSFGVVINEISYDPGDDSKPVEFIELLNGGIVPVDLSGWFIDDAVSYVFPQGTTIGAGEYLIVAQHVTGVEREYGVDALGPFQGRLNNSGETIVLRDSTGVKQDEVDYQLGFPWPTIGDDPDRSIQLINPNFENDIGGNWRSAPVTPGAPNSVFALNAPPLMRRVNHAPEAPKPGEDVTITMKVTDPEGVASVELEYQLVDPGDYIAINDSRYNTQWTSVVMVDDGTGGDEQTNDDIYTAVLPGSLQTHRRLVRYRVTAEDALGASILAPYEDDSQPNFAYFVYDETPEWVGADRPGVTPEVTYDSELLDSVATYHLITTRQAHVDAQFIPGTTRGSGYRGSDYLWHGALVYDGVVYDHIRFRARGGVWRYAMGKNMWKFDFNRGHGFEARDDYGNKYEVDWDKLNLSALIQQGDTGFRGEQGLLESVGFKLFNLAGVAAPNTNYVHFRIIESADEDGTNQFDSDFQGLYLAIEQLDDQFLEQHGLPDGNLYKMENGTGVGGIGGESNNQGDFPQPSDSSDLINFKTTYEQPPTESAAWWEDNLDLDNYYSYRSILEAVHHYDTGFGKNYFYYHNPETSKWETLPWDLDLIFNNNMFGNGAEPFRDRVLPFPEFNLGYQNRMREILDLLYNSEQTGMLVDEVASFVYTPGELSFVDADRAMWDYNPILVSGNVNSGKAGHGFYYAGGRNSGLPAFGNFEGIADEIKNYVVQRTNFINNTVLTNENEIPATPIIQYRGEAGFPANVLDFRSSAYVASDSEFAAMQWRLAEVTDPTHPSFDPTAPRKYEIDSVWDSGELTTFDRDTTIPGSAVEAGKLYRVRVRYQDVDGRWSHWSAPEQFVAGPAVGEATRDLRITEVNYHPHDALTVFGELGVDADEYEFVELTNVGQVEVSLAGVQFVQVDVEGDNEGVAFAFNDEVLAPGESIVVVENLEAFQSRYGLSVNVAGEWSGGLSNGGERLTLIDGGGLVIQSFDYDDSVSWPSRPDGVGSTLEALDPTGDYNSATNWRASSEFGGTPGEASAGPVFDVIANEILSRAADGLDNQVELINITGDSVDLSKWYLSNDDSDLFKFQFTDGASIGSGQYLVLSEQQLGFSFDGQFDGELWLLESDPTTGKPLRFADALEFDATDAGVSLGRWANNDPTANLFPMTGQTLGGANSGPVLSDVIISEVHYNPEDVPAEYQGVIELSELEFVEIYNNADAAADITGWSTDAISFAFPQGASIAAGEAVVLVRFDPAVEIDKAGAFRDIFSVTAGVQIFGPADGQLNNAGEHVKLLRPEDPVTMLTGSVLVDTVEYDPTSPWPPSADGGGDSLNRASPETFGDFASSWTPGVPSPGQVVFNTASADFDANGAIDGFDFLAWQRGFGTSAPNATARDGDADNDQDVDELDLAVWEASFGAQAASASSSATAFAAQSLQLAAANEAAADTPSELTPTLVDFALLEDRDLTNGQSATEESQPSQVDAATIDQMLDLVPYRAPWKPSTRSAWSTVPSDGREKPDEAFDMITKDAMDKALSRTWNKDAAQ